ncbi:MAG: tellurite resistance TerB family protein [Rhodospirillales bacterium]|jgi:tellurite resistance protein|nr:tellurite resistance TerB family protein [Rhodospirillales bacterium]
MPSISYHAALVYTMVMTSASDRNMTDAELRRMGEIIRSLPVFEDYNRDLLPQTAAACAELLDDEDGLEQALDLIDAALPAKLRETAYALACDVAAADGKVETEEMRMLEILRHRLNLDRLVAAGIERGARARFSRP